MSTSINVTIQGVKQIQSRLNKIKQVGVVLWPLFNEAELMMTHAKRNTPVATGRLRASGRVEAPKIAGTMVIVELGFHTNYAVYVHENMSARHVVGSAKFLENAVVGGQTHLERALAAAIAKAAMP